MTILRLEDLFMTYGDEKYAELGIFVDLLRALSFLHQTHHWQASGPDFYGDHLLFERLYSQANEGVDGVAERSVGLGSPQLVQYRHSLANMPKFLGAIDDSENLIMNPADKMVRKSLVAEKSFITAGQKLMDQLKSKGLLTRGLEQLLGTILDNHESSVYLLQRRVVRA